MPGHSAAPSSTCQEKMITWRVPATCAACIEAVSITPGVVRRVMMGAAGAAAGLTFPIFDFTK
jgi:hypothetical protein